MRKDEIQQQILVDGELPSLLTPAQRQFLSPSKPVEELYDIHNDPFEINNLVENPAYANDLARLRRMLEEWQQSYPDLGRVDEMELFERWWPDGRIPKTDAPTVSIEAGRVAASCATEAAVIGWTADPPPPSPSGEPNFTVMLGRVVGNPNSEGRYWHIYTEPFEPANGQTYWFRAHRLGFAESEDVLFM
ncbi:MAG: hypothetical protein AAF639_08450 [Chloroflexota bacterium]